MRPLGAVPEGRGLFDGPLWSPDSYSLAVASSRAALAAPPRLGGAAAAAARAALGAGSGPQGSFLYEVAVLPALLAATAQC